MEYTEFGSTGMRVSRICFGTWAFGGEWGEQDTAENRAAIRTALDLGINFFDTAHSYGFGVAEQLLREALGPALHAKRDQLFLTTKGGLRIVNGKMVRDSSRAWLRQELEASLRALDVDYVDLYLIHWPDSTIPIDYVVETLTQFVDEGKARFIGGSNFSLRDMQAFNQLRRLDGTQPPYHLFRRGIESRILPFCAEHRVGVQAYGPLAHGLLTGRLTTSTTFPDNDWRSKSDIFKGETFMRNLETVVKLKRIADQRQCTLPQLAVGWVLAHAAVDCAVVGAMSPAEITDTAMAADIHLTRAEMNRINQVMRSAVSVGGPFPEALFTVDAAAVSAAHEAQSQMRGSPATGQ